MRQFVKPLPAVAAGTGPFEVIGIPSDCGGSCAPPADAKPGLFNVPLEIGSIQALAIRIHELGHLGLWRMGAISGDMLPALKRSRIHYGWVQTSLDVVVNAFMFARGHTEIAQLKLWGCTLPAELPRWLAAMEFLRSEGLSREVHMRMSMQARAQFTPDELNLLCSTSRLLQQRGAQAAPLPVKELRKLLKTLQAKFGPDSTTATHPLLPSFIVTCERSPGGGHGPKPSGRNEWGPMEISEPPLTCRSAGRRAKLPKKLLAGYCGAFRFPYRALLPAADGRVFGLKKRIHGGSVLVDCSGSMHFSSEQLRSLLSQSPAAIVALYAGLPGGESGSLLIVAKDGRFAEVEEATSGFANGNVVDGPALQWLARQAEPRIWISDGFVTGRGDSSGTNLNAERDLIVRAARIKRIESLEAC